ncbi:MAG: hypothetical protein ACKPH7_22770, partial [Planktothrix sp.]
NHSNDKVRHNASEALGEIAPREKTEKTIKILLDTLNDNDQSVRYRTAVSLNSILRKLDSDDLKKALTEVEKKGLTKSNDWRVRLGAAEALGSSGRDVKTAIIIFKELLEKNTDEITQEVINSLIFVAKELYNITSNLTWKEKSNAQEGLQDILDYLNKKKYSSNSVSIEEAKSYLITTLKAINHGFYNYWNILIFIINYPLESLLILWLFFVFTTFYLRPLWLFKSHDILQRYIDEITLPDPVGKIIILFLKILLLWSCYRPRVLDAWVKANLNKARKEFDKKTTVKERTIYVPIPVILDGIDIAELTAKELQPKFSEQQECLLIWGEGGSGKTSLACQIARWAMSDAPEKRLCKHRMLPILIEQELDFKVPEGKQAFIELIRGSLKNLVDAQNPVSEEFLEQLLIQQRLLVIVDHFSEMSPATREQIRPE